jgi:hypothetical protein
MSDIINKEDELFDDEDQDMNSSYDEYDEDEIIDIKIELTDDEDTDVDIIDEEEIEIIPDEISETEDDITLSKHKQDGKHSLKYDSIFKGKKDDVESDNEPDVFEGYFNETFELDRTSSFYFETRESETYFREKNVKEKIYEVLVNKTELNFMNNRRKPSRIDFNNYYMLLKTELRDEHFSNIEIFNELAVYFSDNLFNMFKLLDNKWRNMIISELHEHIGKSHNSKEITNRNIYEGTEIEFKNIDIFGKEKLFTGVVIETDYEQSNFKIDSFENIYDIHITSITKILNNTKFKHNLNKLDNIDFL